MRIYTGLIIFLLSVGLTTACQPRVPLDPPPGRQPHSSKTAPPKIITSTAYGKFSGNVASEWLDNGQMRLLEAFSYQDPRGKLWLAPKGSIVNGASIPSQFWGVVGGPFSGNYRKASVIHDVACVKRKRPWPMVHRAFYTAMRAGGVPSTRAKIMYAAVRFFGPRWKTDGTRTPTPNKISDKQFDDLKAQIESGKLSLDQIDDFQ